MSNKGFTLTELLASITILAVISAIAAFSYSKVMKDNKIKQCEQKVLYIEKQAIKYASDNPIIFRNNENKPNIEKLICEGYLVINDGVNLTECTSTEKVIIEEDEDAINPLTNNLFQGYVEITKTNGLIDASYIGDKCE